MSVQSSLPNEESWRQSCGEFNRGRYWHAHEGWERGWLTLPPEEKEYIQALIQVAAAAVLLQKGRVGAACSVAARALEKLRRARPPEPREGAFRVAIPGAEQVLEQLLSSAHEPGAAPRILEAFSRLRAAFA